MSMSKLFMLHVPQRFILVQNNHPKTLLTNNTTSSSTIKLLLRTMFYNTSKIHNKIVCQENCTSLYNDEIKRLVRRTSSSINGCKIKTISYCAKTTYWWLVYVEGSGMFCFLCKKHHIINTQNKYISFGENPAVRMKTSALLDHIASKKKTQCAIEAEMLNRV